MKVEDYAIHGSGLDFVVGDAVREVKSNGPARAGEGVRERERKWI